MVQGKITMRLGILTILLYLTETKGNGNLYKFGLTNLYHSITHDIIYESIITLNKTLMDLNKKMEMSELRDNNALAYVKKIDADLYYGTRTLNSTMNEVNNVITRIEQKLTMIEYQMSEREKTYTTETARLHYWMSKIEDMLMRISKINNGSLCSKLESRMKADEKWYNSVIGKLEKLESTNEVLLASSKKDTDSYTKEELAKIRNEIHYLGSDKLMNIDANLQEIMKSTNQLQNVCNTTQDLKKSFMEYFSQGNVEPLTKSGKLIQTADNVLETRKLRIEPDVHKTLLEIGELVKSETNELNNTLKNRFNYMSETILENQNGGVSTLSSKIDDNIKQVWRQFQIMQDKLVKSDKTLSKLQLQGELYLNGSLSTKDCMDDSMLDGLSRKVSDVKESVNSLKHRLLLFTEEFKETKDDLLTSIKSQKGNSKGSSFMNDGEFDSDFF